MSDDDETSGLALLVYQTYSRQQELESLALQEIYPVGTAQFCGSFRHHAAFRCASWVGIDAVLSLAFEAGGGDVIVITPRP